jgi:hypothetical protein
MRILAVERAYSPLAEAAFAWGRFPDALFAAVFDAAFFSTSPMARFAAHRFLSAATIFRLPSADNFRFGLLAATSEGGADVAFFAAHRRLCASANRLSARPRCRRAKGPDKERRPRRGLVCSGDQPSKASRHPRPSTPVTNQSTPDRTRLS